MKHYIWDIQTQSTLNRFKKKKIKKISRIHYSNKWFNYKNCKVCIENIIIITYIKSELDTKKYFIIYLFCLLINFYNYINTKSFLKRRILIGLLQQSTSQIVPKYFNFTVSQCAYDASF